MPTFAGMSTPVNSVKGLFAMIRDRLSRRLHPDEAGQQAYWLLEALFGKSRTDLMLDRPFQLRQEEEEKLAHIMQRLDAHEPIQYVLEQAPFYGRWFKVRPGALIPRPETEELVHRIISRHQQTQGLRILDIGTGSGCIAISLALELPGSSVMALDVSEEALSLAKENAEELQADVHFIRANILEENPPEVKSLDILVSNPPYVREEEAELMQPNVLEWEPHLALFVKNDDPLLFYHRITFLATKYLRPGGSLYFEINEACGDGIAELLRQAGFTAIAILKDMQGKDRMAEARWMAKK